uniref:Uncharacterized protein n=1 Tax=Glossina pallidipes TaxID=7398 RepID=A0A1B0AIH8_GLOPL
MTDRILSSYKFVSKYRLLWFDWKKTFCEKFGRFRTREADIYFTALVSNSEQSKFIILKYAINSDKFYSSSMGPPPIRYCIAILSVKFALNLVLIDSRKLLLLTTWVPERTTKFTHSKAHDVGIAFCVM